MSSEIRPGVCVLKTDGTNCDEETKFAFESAGGNAKIVHINDLRHGEERLSDYQILAMPGGFANGDDVAAGKILAVEMSTQLGDQIFDFVEGRKGLVIGICNGFQALTRMGLLPFRQMGEMAATLTTNEVGGFGCRWIDLQVDPRNKCVFLKDMPTNVTYQVAHGEGKFYTDERTLENIEGGHLVALRYVDKLGHPTQEFPANPNGSLNAIAGISDQSGRILGMMPHPERFVRMTQYPNWRKYPDIEPQGLPIFKGMVDYARKS